MVNSVIFVYNALMAIWIIWLLYWGGSWVYEMLKGQRKKIIKGKRRINNVLLSIALILVLFPETQQLGFLGFRFIPVLPVLWYVGLAIAAIGIFFAILARYYLGSNWSSIPALRKGQKLVRTGPYSIVRHPIYTGILFGMIGSAIVVGQYRNLIALVLILIFCWSRIHDEERIMEDEFGKEYSIYKKEVKTIIPWIL
jgi:protein-S-isoprenylcysteine O-methyltransferase Ste14